jgi:uncharacterized RDD family membrane protein YckC
VDTAAAALSFVLVMIPIEPFLIARGWIEIDRDIGFTFFGNWYSAAWLVLFFSLSTYFGRGRSAGKLLFRIRVVSLTHDRPTLWQCAERSLGYGFSLLEFGFGFFQFFIHPNRRTVHDRIAETVVVQDLTNNRRKGKPKPE